MLSCSAGCPLMDEDDYLSILLLSVSSAGACRSSMDSLWNPSLRKTLSHPAAAHKVARSGPQDGNSHTGGVSASVRTDSAHLAGPHGGGLGPSKSVKHNSRSKLTSGDAESGALAVAGPAASPPGRAPSKKGLFEGFRNTLRQSRGKGDANSNGGLCSSHSLDRSGESGAGPKGVIRRWSEICPSNQQQGSSGTASQSQTSAAGTSASNNPTQMLFPQHPSANSES
ncbi:hypothetical protein BIW11_01078 [Tropilaelaps mercedesae]|uniref:Uncharacterized protein n=1 Tax=Tropilaelaps mercedesae TaxID=418985 RepID=A0A1V9XJP6_9ACAR|nr:hypothetical protein BIW11_01078 [Tropilaelaps mercedesae]